MSSSSGPVNSISPYLPTSLYFPDQFNEFRVVFLQDRSRIANALNVREIAIFDLNENLTGEQWATAGDPQVKKQTYRIVFYLGAIATGATLVTAHGLTFSSITAHHAWATTDVVDYRPLPYASVTALNQQIEFNVTPTDIVIINGAASPNITSVNVEFRYLKN